MAEAPDDARPRADQGPARGHRASRHDGPVTRGHRRSPAGTRHDRPRARAYDIVSFDVFDTLLVHSCGHPEAMFGWLARSLGGSGLLPVPPELFVHTRLAAETAVWSRAGGFDSHVRLRDIYTEVGRRLALTPHALAEIADAEQDLHERLLRPSPPGFRALADAEAGGARIVYTSDTLLSGAQVEAVLRRHDLWVEGASCFTSSDAGLSKHSGRLFAHVVARLGCEPRRILHVGDNPASDVRRARQAGLSVWWLPEGRLTSHEERLASFRAHSGGLSDALAGASRLVRLRQAGLGERGDALLGVAAGVAAPLMVGYLLWVLGRARALGLRSLWVPSGQGHAVGSIGEVLAERLGVEVVFRRLPAEGPDPGSEAATQAPGPAGVVAVVTRPMEARALHEEATRVAGPGSTLFALGLGAGLGEQAEHTSSEPWLSRTECWLFDDIRGTGVQQVRGLATLARMCGALEPVGSAAAAYEAVVDVARTVELDRSFVVPDADLREAVVDLVGAFWRAPTRAEAAAWGSLPLAPPAPGRDAVGLLAGRYALRTVIADRRRGTYPAASPEHWYEGAVVHGPLRVRLALRMLARAHRIVRSIRPSLVRARPWVRG